VDAALTRSPGSTAGTAWRRDLVGTDPDIIEMSDGTLAMSYGHKPDYEDHGNFSAFSVDQGRTWTQETRLSSSVTMAYTGLREVAPGELFVVYTTSEITGFLGLSRRRLHNGWPQYPGETSPGEALRMRAVILALFLAPIMELSWFTHAPLPRAQAGARPALLGDALVVAGGTAWENDVKQWLAEVQIYDTPPWRLAPRPPAAGALAYGPFVQHGATLEIFGGSAWHVLLLRTIWRLDAKLAHWTRAGEMPWMHSAGAGPRASANASFCLAAALTLPTSPSAPMRSGCAKGQALWREVAKLPGGAVALSAAAVLGRRVYLFGGCSMPAAGQIRNHAEAWSFDTESLAFTRLPNLPAPQPRHHRRGGGGRPHLALRGLHRCGLHRCRVLLRSGDENLIAARPRCPPP
jgi:hypothetical protein